VVKCLDTKSSISEGDVVLESLTVSQRVKDAKVN
jgi:hypothetical protein